MHISINTGRNKQPQKTRSNLRIRSTESGQKKLPNYVQAELQKEAKRLRQEFETSVAELSKHTFSRHTERAVAEDMHLRLNKVIDFFNDNATSYPSLAATIKRLKVVRSKYKLRLEAEPATPAELDEAA